MDKSLLYKVRALKGQGQDVALVTVVATRGSTPRKAGAAMAVTGDGRIFGSIGGGCGEAEARLRALRVIDEGAACLHRLSLVNAVAADEGMACGGDMEIFIRLL